MISPILVAAAASLPLSCDFASWGKDGAFECRATVELGDRNKVSIRCDDGLRLRDRDARARLEHKELEIVARDESVRAELRVDRYTGAPDTKFRAELALLLDQGKGEKRLLSGRCRTPKQNVPPAGSCQPSSSLSVLVTGTNVVSYIPKGSWVGSTKGISAVNIEGASISDTLIPTTNVVNSCASNAVTGQTVCTANNTDVYLLSGTTLNTTLTSGGSGTISFSGGTCTNCGVAIDGVNNRAVIGLALEGKAGFQFLNLGGTPSFETGFPSGNGQISEDPLIDPVRNLLLSPSEDGNYEIVNLASGTTSPAFFENATGGGELDSAGEDCATGIALAPAEFSSPSKVFIADLTQAAFTAGTPAGTWTAPSQVQTLSESSLSAGASGIAVAQGTHLGIVTGEFGGDLITAISLPAASGSGVPAIVDWVTCRIDGFSMGLDPHTVTAYQSPNGGNAIAVLANGGATSVAVVDLTQMLDTTLVPRTAAGHGCAAGSLPAGVVRTVAVP